MDIILYNIIACLASLILGYFFGSIPVGVILCRLFRGEDPRENGSQNSGGTNVGRLYGKKLGAGTIILDAIKTILPMILVWVLINFAGIKSLFSSKLGGEMFHNGALVVMLAPLGATLGHCWPIFAGFRGGKAVASYAGFALLTNWATLILGFLSFGITLKKTKYVSLSSMVGSVVVAILSWTLYILAITTTLNVNLTFWGFGIIELWAAANLEFAIISTLMTGILIFRHRNNIRKLAAGNENKIKWMK
jgi:glycerol-3-phosphate acyltransferase PlsY